MVKVTDKDMGWAAMMRSLAGSGADTLAAYVGPDPIAVTNGPPIKYAGEKIPRAYYPLFLEYGTRRMAPRPFMRWTLDAHDNYREQLRVMAQRVLDRARDGDVFLSLAATLRSLADSVARDIQRTIQGMGVIDTARMFHSVKCLRVVSGYGGVTGGSVVASWGGK
jgi:hypothetical protein